MRPGAPSSKEPPVRTCPVCGISMMASKSRDEAQDYDIFTCPRCDCVIVSRSREPDPERD
jgi:Zn-finger nucleic acid-binding protein